MTSSTTPRIRPAHGSDVDAIRRIYGAAVIGTFASFEEAVPDREELQRRMNARPRTPWLVAESVDPTEADPTEDGDGVLGYAFASRHHERAAYRWSADCSVYLTPAYHGRGIGRLLLERLVGEMHELGYVSLFAGIALPNEASVRLHEGIGFRPAGVFPHAGFKQGSWRDVGWWSLQLVRSLPVDPADPREWDPARWESARRSRS